MVIIIRMRIIHSMVIVIYVANIVLGAWDALMNKTMISGFMEFIF